jgi:hypothetical protein
LSEERQQLAALQDGDTQLQPIRIVVASLTKFDKSDAIK